MKTQGIVETVQSRNTNIAVYLADDIRLSPKINRETIL